MDSINNEMTLLSAAMFVVNVLQDYVAPTADGIGRPLTSAERIRVIELIVVASGK